MASLQELFPSKYLKPFDVQGRMKVTMRYIEIEEIGQDKDKKPILYFKEVKPLILNKTNALAIADGYGDDYDQWGGKQIVLYVTEVDSFGKRTEAIRVMMPQQAAGARTPQNTGRCPECNAPDGKPHATGCSLAKKGQAAPDPDLDIDFGMGGDDEDADSMADFDPYASLFSSPDAQFSPDATELVLKVREWDKQSETALQGNHYKALARLLDTHVGEGETVHHKVLSVLTGKSIAAVGEPGDYPGATLRNLAMILNNPNKHPKEIEALQHIAGHVRLLDLELADA